MISSEQQFALSCGGGGTAKHQIDPVPGDGVIKSILDRMTVQPDDPLHFADSGLGD